jgi:hypothetical protein
MKESMNRSRKAMISTPRIFGSWIYRKTDHRDAPSIFAAW